jgi:transposase
LLQLVNATVEDVSRKERLAYERILGILDRYIRAEVDWSQYSVLDTDFVVIVTARLKNGSIILLGVLENRQKDTAIEFLRSIPEQLKRSIVSACCDMYEGYTEAIREELPHARLVIDLFHIARAYRDG